MVTYTLEMNFLTDLGNTLRIAVNDADPAVSNAEIKSFMNLICEKGIAGFVLSSSGYPTEIKSANLIAKNTTTYI